MAALNTSLGESFLCTSYKIHKAVTALSFESMAI